MYKKEECCNGEMTNTNGYRVVAFEEIANVMCVDGFHCFAAKSDKHDIRG